jgi:hypothetical protein
LGRYRLTRDAATEMKEKIEKFKEERIGGKKRDFVETVKVEGGGDLMDTRGG